MGQKELKENVLALLRRNLEDGAKVWLDKNSNPLATEIYYIDEQIEAFKKGIQAATNLHNRHHENRRSNPKNDKITINGEQINIKESSVMQYEIVNFRTMIEVAEEWKAELLGLRKNDVSRDTAVFDIKAIFKEDCESLPNKLLVNLDIMDEKTGDIDLSARKNVPQLIAVVTAVHSRRKKVLNKEYSLGKILDCFNKSLGSDYSETISKSKKFPKLKEKALLIIDNFIKKL